MVPNRERLAEGPRMFLLKSLRNCCFQVKVLNSTSTEINCPPPYDVGRSLGDRAVTPIHPHVHLPVQHDRPAGHMQPSHPDVHLPVQRERPVSDMQLSNDESTSAQEGHSRPERTRLPLMQRRLQPHNKPGLRETPPPGSTGILYSR